MILDRHECYRMAGGRGWDLVARAAVVDWTRPCQETTLRDIVRCNILAG